MKLGVKYQRWLMASYLYYKEDISIWADEEYDEVGRELLENWDTFEHRHKHLISKEDLEAGTAYAVQYPLIIKSSAIRWYNMSTPTK